MAKKEDFKPNGFVTIDGIEVPTFKKEIISANMLEVEVGTTGHQGGDSGHGGRTYFKVENLSSTDMTVEADGSGSSDVKVEITLGGDSELDTFCEALRIGYNVLKEHAFEIDEYVPSPLEMRQERFALYVNELCALYRKTGKLSGMSEIRNKHHITGLTQQQFFECGLNKASGYVSLEFCYKLYAFILDSSKAIPTPKYTE